MSVLIKTLDFTKSVGRRDTPNDGAFSDITDVGGFPFEQKIRSIAKIEIFSDTRNQDDAVIVGLKVMYNLLDGETRTIDRGLVNEERVGGFTISDDQIIVGVYGQLKNNAGKPSDGRVATISFVLCDKRRASVKIEGPFQGTDLKLGTVWGSFGQIIAFQGTRADGHGITSLGFVKDDVALDFFTHTAVPGQP